MSGDISQDDLDRAASNMHDAISEAMRSAARSNAMIDRLFAAVADLESQHVRHTLRETQPDEP